MTDEPKPESSEEKTPETEPGQTSVSIDGAESASADASKTEAVPESSPNKDDSVTETPAPVPASSSASPASPAKFAQRRRRPLLMLIAYIWIPFSFLIPYGLMNQMAMKSYRTEERVSSAPLARRIEDARNEALVSGVVGLIIALTIFALWRIDQRLHRNPAEEKDIKVSVILAALGFLLWFVWLCAGHIMMRAHFEINDVPPQLPGLEGY